MLERLKRELRALRGWVDVAGVVVAGAVIFAHGWSYPTLFPEVPWLWSLVNAFDLARTLHTYVEIDGAWYKPTELYLLFWLLGQVFSWHDIFAFRLVTLVEYAALALLFRAVLLELLPGQRLVAFVTSALVFSHPALFILVYENLAQVLLYALFVVGGALCFLRVASSARPRLAAAGAVLCFAASLTCREQAFALPGLFGGWWLLELLFRREFSRARRLQALALGASLVVAAAYWKFHIVTMNALAGAYRNVFDASAIVKNLVLLPEWLVRWFADPRTSYLVRPNSGEFDLICAHVLLALGLPGLVIAIDRHRVAGLRVLLFLLAWTAVFLAIPVYSGGEVWHLILPVLSVSALMAWGVANLVSSRPLPLLAFAAVVLAVGAVQFTRQFDGARFWLYQLNAEAVLSPPVARERMPKGALVFYDTTGLAEWHVGAGHLFPFAYLDPSLQSVGVQPETISLAETARWLSAEHAFYFRYSKGQWLDHSEEFRAPALMRLAQRASELEGRPAEALPLLRGVPPRLLARALRRLPPSRAAAVLGLLDPEARQAVLGLLSAEAAARVERPARATALVPASTDCSALTISTSGGRFECTRLEERGEQFWRLTAREDLQWLVVVLRPTREGLPAGGEVSLTAVMRAAPDQRVLAQVFDFEAGAWRLADRVISGDGAWTAVSAWRNLPRWNPEDYTAAGLAPAKAGQWFDLKLVTLVEPGGP